MPRPLHRLRLGRSARTLLISLVTGVVVAFVVAGFELLTTELLFHRVFEQPLWVVALAPAVGIGMSALILRYLHGGTPGTSDEYVRAFHERTPRLPFLELPGKLLAGVTTIGMGGAMGLEGPSIYAGSTVGLGLHARLHRFLRRDDAKLLLTAGAAAGVAAVFKAPATGVIFALEAPYRDDVTRRALMPALVASAAAYTTFVGLVGGETVVPFLGSAINRLGLEDSGEGTLSFQAIQQAFEMFDEAPRAQLSDLLGATLLGVGAGLGGRFFGILVRHTKSLSMRVSLLRRLAFFGALLAVLAVASDLAFDEPLTLGPGVEAMEWVVEPDQGLGLIALLFGMRLVATMASLAAGGVGGLFIPLATQGVILGQFVGLSLGNEEPGLYPTLGLAAFLGAGYRTPITAVMFVAEQTVGSFVVPALIAAAVSQIVAGNESVSLNQRTVRLGHLERRFTLPLTSILETDVLTVPPDASVSEFVYVHVLGRRVRAVPVVEGGRYLGMALLERVSEVDRDDWDTVLVRDVMDTAVPAARPSWTLRDAVVAMEDADVESLPVCDSSGTFIGVVLEADILKLDEILDETGTGT